MNYSILKRKKYFMMIVTTNLDDGDDKPRACLVSESDCPKICHCLDLKVGICRTRLISILEELSVIFLFLPQYC